MHKSTYEQELALRGELIYVTEGTSMRPFIHSGKDLVVITAKEKRPVRKFDAVFYRRDSGQYVLHRVVKVTRRGYALRGDNRRCTEYGIQDRHILGVLTAVIRDGQRIDVDTPEYRREVRRWCALYPIRWIQLLFRGVG